MSADEAAVRSAVRADLDPAAKRVQALLQIKDEKEFRAEANALLADFPDMEYEILKAPQAAKTFEKIIGKAYLCGMVLAEQSRIGCFEAELAISQETGDRRGEGKAWFNLATAYATLKNREKAIVHAERSLSIFETLACKFHRSV